MKMRESSQIIPELAGSISTFAIQYPKTPIAIIGENNKPSTSQLPFCNIIVDYVSWN